MPYPLFPKGRVGNTLPARHLAAIGEVRRLQKLARLFDFSEVNEWNGDFSPIIQIDWAVCTGSAN